MVECAWRAGEVQAPPTPIVLQPGDVRTQIDFAVDSSDPIFHDGF